MKASPHADDSQRLVWLKLAVLGHDLHAVVACSAKLQASGQQAPGSCVISFLGRLLEGWQHPGTTCGTNGLSASQIVTWVPSTRKILHLEYTLLQLNKADQSHRLVDLRHSINSVSTAFPCQCQACHDQHAWPPGVITSTGLFLVQAGQPKLHGRRCYPQQILLESASSTARHSSGQELTQLLHKIFQLKLAAVIQLTAWPGSHLVLAQQS